MAPGRLRTLYQQDHPPASENQRQNGAGPAERLQEQVCGNRAIMSGEVGYLARGRGIEAGVERVMGEDGRQQESAQRRHHKAG